MPLSRKNYEAVAHIVKSETDVLGLRENLNALGRFEVEQVIASIAHDLANYFETDNARFDRAKFLAACGGW